MSEKCEMFKGPGKYKHDISRTERDRERGNRGTGGSLRVISAHSHGLSRHVIASILLLFSLSELSWLPQLNRKHSEIVLGCNGETCPTDIEI